MMTDYSSTSLHESTSTSGSSDMVSDAKPAFRIIRLFRQNYQNRSCGNYGESSSFGFSIRGGREFGTGFFISRIIKGSEADQQGLRVGDQIIRLNGYHVDDAVHKEISNFIMNQSRLKLKVRSIGMLPIKENYLDQLSWQLIPIRPYGINKASEHPTQDVSITLKLAAGAKLGLGICKGPEWKPGIFVQFTKEKGLARNAGLRPGDQILSCNNVDFHDISFIDSVSVMKSSNILELVLRLGAGIDLFPGESSGYNSSASSVTGDQSPYWGDHDFKRLSIVKEESFNDRLANVRPRSWDRKDLDRRKFNIKPVEPPKAPENFRNNCHTIDKDTSIVLPNESNNKLSGNTTIITLTEKETVINNTHVHSPVHISNCTNKQSMTTVHVGSYENKDINVNIKNNSNNGNIDSQSGGNVSATDGKTIIVEVHRSDREEVKPPPPPPPMFGLAIEKPDTDSGSCNSSLMSEISKELQRRAGKRDGDSSVVSQTTENKKVLAPRLPSQQNDKQHNALMSEFLLAHQKMFKNSKTVQDDKSLNEKNVDDNSSKSTDDKPTTLPQPPSSAGLIAACKLNNVESLPPPTPTPDYDSTPNSTITRTLANGIKRNNQLSTGSITNRNDSAEMSSIESFKLNNSTINVVPKPPSLYFSPQHAKLLTYKNNEKNSLRPSIMKENGSSRDNTNRGVKFNIMNDEIPTNGFKKELERTLSRDNTKSIIGNNESVLNKKPSILLVNNVAAT